MTTRYSLFTKMMLLILTLLVPVILLIGYSHKVSVDVVETELQETNRRQLAFLLHQMDTSIAQLQDSTVMLIRDPSLRDLPNLLYKESPLERINTKLAVMEKLTLQSVSSNWPSQLIVHSPIIQQSLNAQFSLPYDERYLAARLSPEWRLETIQDADDGERRIFKRLVPDTVSPSDRLAKTKLILEVNFDARNIAAMLSNYQEGGRGSPFMYRQGELPIRGPFDDGAAVPELIAWLDGQDLSREGSLDVLLGGSRYLVSYVRSSVLDWYLVDILPMEDVLSPIYKSRNLFFFAIGVLLFTSLVALVLLYRNIQIPIRQLVKGFKRIRDRQFSVRVPISGNHHEFAYMQQGFNEMAKEIQRLVESVYEEKIHSRDARLKQLQAQVNPHFLYNCLAFITSMNEMENREAVASMAHNLGDYYRYTTRSDKEKATLREELSVVRNYLHIQQMRMPRLQFEIRIPEELEDLLIPRLSLQPIVENAVVHGIEMKPGDAVIRMTGTLEDGRVSIVVDDNGLGLQEARIRELESRMRLPEGDAGYGLWNTNQRLQLMFGKGSGIALEPSPLGGLRVRMYWLQGAIEEEGGF